MGAIDYNAQFKFKVAFLNFILHKNYILNVSLEQLITELCGIFDRIANYSSVFCFLCVFSLPYKIKFAEQSIKLEFEQPYRVDTVDESSIDEVVSDSISGEQQEECMESSEKEQPQMYLTEVMFYFINFGGF